MQSPELQQRLHPTTMLYQMLLVKPQAMSHTMLPVDHHPWVRSEHNNSIKTNHNNAAYVQKTS
jgi:hypothetical protein